MWYTINIKWSVCMYVCVGYVCVCVCSSDVALSPHTTLTPKVATLSLYVCCILITYGSKVAYVLCLTSSHTKRL